MYLQSAPVGHLGILPTDCCRPRYSTTCLRYSQSFSVAFIGCGNLHATKNNKTLGRKIFHLSKDGKWKSFPKVPHLLKYVSNRTYYARATINGKEFRPCLETGASKSAKLRFAETLQEKTTRKQR
jgi:hypothetical protein